jgi:hypothetical protein
VTLYSVDTSALITGRRDVLPAQTFGTFWHNVEVIIRRGDVRAVDVVRDELRSRDDDTRKWASQQTGLFVPLRREIQLATREVLRAHPRLTGVAKNRNGADPFVIGYAIALGGTVVTEERHEGSTNRPRIPVVCDLMGVPWTNLVGLAAAYGAGFVERPLDG